MKVTLRVPEDLMDRLREKSRVEGRSLNDAAVAALASGLGAARDDGWRSLGSLVSVPPERAYDPAEFAKLRAATGACLSGFMEALDWVRGEP